MKIQFGAMLEQLVQSLFTKPNTIMYPADKETGKIKKFRGDIKFDCQKCIGCNLCMKDCPAGAIVIKKVGEKRFECDIDRAKCIYCAQCVDSCPRKALRASDEFELAQLNRKSLEVVYEAKPEEPKVETPNEPQTPANPETK